MKKNIAAFVLIVIVIVLAGLYAGIKSSKQRIVPGTGQDQGYLYVDPDNKFSLVLPNGWTVADRIVATTSSNTWFHDPSGKDEDTNASMVVGWFARTEPAENIISRFGEDFFLGFIAEEHGSGIPTYKVSTTSDMQNINGRIYKMVAATYTGAKTDNEVIQYIYLTLTDDAYFRIGIDSYSKNWEEEKDKIMGSLNTLILNPDRK